MFVRLFTDMHPTQDQVMAALSTVIDPDFHKDLVTLGMIKNVTR